MTLKKITKEEIALDVFFLRTEYTENSRKKGCTQGTAPERTTCLPYKLTDYKFSADEEKYRLFTP